MHMILIKVAIFFKSWPKIGEFKVDAVSLTPLNKKNMYNIKIPSVERGLVLHFAGDYKLHF